AALPFMGACAPEEEPPPPPPPEDGEEPPPPPPEVKTYTFGFSWPLNSALGIESARWWEIIIPEFNEKGGMVVNGQRYKLDWIMYDDKYTAEGARANTERLVHEDKVDMMWCLGSGPSIGVIPVTEEAHMLFFSCGGSPKLLAPEYKYIWPRMTNGAAIEESALAYIMGVYPEAKTFVSFTIDDESGHSSAETSALICEKLGLTVLPSVYYPRETIDYAPMAVKLSQLNPDIISFGGTEGGSELGVQVKAMWETGWRGIRYSSFAINMAEFGQMVTKEQMEGVHCGYLPMGDTDLMNEKMRHLKEAYIAKYGDWTSTGSSWVLGWWFWLAAVQKADSLNTDDIIAVLPFLTVETHEGWAQLVKRIDTGEGVLEKFGVVCEHSFGVIHDGKLVAACTYSLEDTIKAYEQVWGFSCR
ncbi:unnamed protein product, partial [marine sediment metagenome]